MSETPSDDPQQNTDTNWYSEETATLGDRLMSAREAAGLSQKAMAAQLGVKVATLNAWENDRKEPRANRVQMMTGLLGVSLGWLLTGVGEGPEMDEGMVTVTPELSDLLSEVRAVRAAIAQSGVKLGQLEKRLRKAIKDQ